MVALRLFLLCVGFLVAATAPSAAQYRFDWSGHYLGVNAGWNWGSSDAPTAAVRGTCGSCYVGAIPAGITGVGSQTVETSGLIGGLQGGYNWQFGSLLVGYELDFQYFRSAGSTSATSAPGAFGPPGFTATVNSHVTTDWLITARPRLGAVIDNWLVYGTGGVAFTQLKANWSFTESFNPGSLETASASAVKMGWVVGGGVETALPGRWTLGLEYLYVNFGNVNVDDANLVVPQYTPPLADQRFTRSADLTAGIVRARLNKSF